MIKCVIVDDEKPAREALALILSNYFGEKLVVVGLAGSVREGVLLVYEHKPQLVFLDIQMQGENGFELFNYFQSVDFSVIFVTAYQEFAIKAIKVAALDYLLKPIGIQELKETIGRYEKLQTAGISNEHIEKLMNSLHPGYSSNKKVALPTFSGFQFEKMNEIIYCEADQNYSKVFTINGSELLISKPLNSLQNLLSCGSFYRIHKSHLVNLDYVKSYSRSDGFHVVLENGTKLSVATRRNEDFIKTLTNK